MRSAVSISPVDKKGPLRVTPPSQQSPYGRPKIWNHPLGDCPAFRAFIDRPTKQIRLCGRSQTLLQSAFLCRPTQLTDITHIGGWGDCLSWGTDHNARQSGPS